MPQQYTHAQYLATLSVSDTETVATHLHIHPVHLIPRVGDVEFWATWYDGLPHPTRAFLDRIRRAGGALPVVIAQSIGGVLRTSLETLSPRTYLTIHHPLSPLEQLFVAGVLWRTDKSWLIPATLEALLPDTQALFAGCERDAQQIDEVPDVHECLLHIACMALDGRLPMQQHGRVSTVVSQRLRAPGAYVQWLVACCVAGGALRSERNTYVPTRTMVDWLALSATERQQELTRAWLQATWSEWDVPPKRRPPALDVRQARRALFQAVLPHMRDEWCAVSALLDALQMGWMDVLRTPHGDVRWVPPAGWPTAWHTDDGALIQRMWCGPCVWLGLLESADDGSVVRRTAVGAWLAGLQTEPPQAPPMPVVLEHDFSVVIPDRRNIWARFQLHRIGVHIDDYTVQLAPQYAKKALANGMTMNEYVETVAAIVAEPLAPDVRLRLLGWASDVVHVTLSQKTVLTCADAQTMTELCLDRRLASLEIERLNDTTASIERSRSADCVRKLRDVGYVVDASDLRGDGFSMSELAILERGLAHLPPSDEVASVRARIQQLRRRGGA